MHTIKIQLTDKQLKKIDKFAADKNHSYNGRLGFITFLIRTGLAQYEDMERIFAGKSIITSERLEEIKRDIESHPQPDWCETFRDVYQTYERCCK